MFYAEKTNRRELRKYFENISPLWKSEISKNVSLHLKQMPEYYVAYLATLKSNLLLGIIFFVL